MAVELEAKQAELRGKQAQLDSAAEEATRLQGRFEEQARQLTQCSEQAESLQKDLSEAANAQEDVVKVFVLPFVILCKGDASVGLCLGWPQQALLPWVCSCVIGI